MFTVIVTVIVTLSLIKFWNLLKQTNYLAKVYLLLEFDGISRERIERGFGTERFNRMVLHAYRRKISLAEFYEKTMPYIESQMGSHFPTQEEKEAYCKEQWEKHLNRK